MRHEKWDGCIVLKATCDSGADHRIHFVGTNVMWSQFVGQGFQGKVLSSELYLLHISYFKLLNSAPRFIYSAGDDVVPRKLGESQWLGTEVAGSLEMLRVGIDLWQKR